MQILSDFLSQAAITESLRSTEVDKAGHFYHVTQQGYSYGVTFSLNGAKHRMHLLYSICSRYRVMPLCNVVMPTHTHDIFYSDDFRNISKVMQSVNTSVSKFIHRERIANGRKDTDPVFASYPYYERIKDREHLFYTFKYLYENPQYLKKENRFVPFSCFDQWEKGYFKPYNETVYKLLFGKDLREIMDLCTSLTKEQFRIEASKLFKGVGELEGL